MPEQKRADVEKAQDAEQTEKKTVNWNLEWDMHLAKHAFYVALVMVLSIVMGPLITTFAWP